MFQFLNPLRRIERLIMTTKEEMQQQIDDLVEMLDEKLDKIDERIADETSQQKEIVVDFSNRISVLEAQILQLKNDPSVPVEFDFAGLREQIARLDKSADAISDIVADVDSGEEEEEEEDEVLEEDESQV